MSRNIGVFYLNRYGNDPNHIRIFLKSISKFATGIEYKPYFIQKGFPHGSNITRHAWITSAGTRASSIEINDDGLDLTAYRKAALQTDVEYCLFFNSYSRILAPNWLEHYENAIKVLGENFLIGATGSYSRHGISALRETVPPPFVGAHVRSNAFLVSRKQYLSFEDPLQTKEDCHMFEAGPASMSQRIRQSGGSLAVVDRLGRVSLPEDWPTLNVFSAGRQENLLVADNQTHFFQMSKLSRRTRLARGVWGVDRGHAVADPWLRRKWWKLSWQYGVGVTP